VAVIAATAGGGTAASLAAKAATTARSLNIELQAALNPAAHSSNRR
jgi:hypothetical protein